MDGLSWEIFLATLPTVITGAGFWFSERYRDRDLAQKRQKVISEESARVDYLRSWLKTVDLAPGSERPDVICAREGISDELIRSHRRLTEVLAGEQLRAGSAEAPSAALRAWHRALLAPLDSPGARVVRWSYWLFLVLGLVLPVAYMTSGVEAADGSPLSPAAVLIGGLIIFLPFFAISLLFRGWAVWLEHRRHIRRATRPEQSVPQGFPAPAAYTPPPMKPGTWFP